MVEQWSPKPKVKGSNPFSPDLTTRIQSPFGLGRAVCPLSPQRWFGRNCLVRSWMASTNARTTKPIWIGPYGEATLRTAYNVLAVSLRSTVGHQRITPLSTKPRFWAFVLVHRVERRSVHAVLGLTQTLAFSDGGLLGAVLSSGRSNCCSTVGKSGPGKRARKKLALLSEASDSFA